MLQSLPATALQILDSLPDPFIVLDGDGRFMYANQHFLTATQRAGNDVLGCVVWDCFPDAVGTPLHERYQRVMRDHAVEEFELYYTPLGAWLEVKAFPHEGGVAVHFRDVTARKALIDEQARMQETLRQKERHATTLQRITSALGGALTSRDVTTAVLKEAREAIGAYAGAVALTHARKPDGTPDTTTLYLVNEHGYQPNATQRWTSVPQDARTPIRDALKHGAPVLLPDRDAIIHAYPHLQPVMSPKTHALAVLPFLLKDGAGGALVLSFTEQRDFPPAEHAFLEAVATQLAIALERAHLYEQEATARVRSHTLAQASELLSTSLNVRDTLDALTQLAIQHVADWCSVFLPDDEGHPRVAAIAHHDPARRALVREYTTRYPSDPAQPYSVAWVQRTGESVFMPVVPSAVIDALPDEERRTIIRSLGLHSIITVPLLTAGRPIGVLNLATSTRERTYTPDDLAFAQELARRAAYALENARLYEQIVLSEERYRSLVDATKQIVWTTGPRGEILTDQRGWQELTGQTRDQYTHERWADTVHPDDRSRTIWAWRRAIESATPLDLEHRVRVRDGTYRWFHVRAVPVLNDDSTVREWVGVHTDITDRKQAEQDIRHLNQSLERRVEERTRELARVSHFNRLLLDSAGEGIIGNDRHGRVTFANPAALRMFGFTAEEFIGQDQHVLVHHTHADGTPYPETDCPIAQARQGGATVTVDSEVFWRKDGTSFPVEYVTTPLHAPDGTLEGAVTIFRDITDRIHAQEELKAAVDRLRRSNAELERFAYVASHDLQEPLRTIASFTELLARRYEPHLDEQGSRMLHMIVRGAERMKVLIDDLLVFSRLSNVEEAREPVDTGAVLREVLTRLQAGIERAGAEVTFGDLPVVLASLPEVTQLLQNLVANAIKFQRPGVPPRVHILAEREGETWHFRVQDNGIGIDEQYRDRIFQIFQRLHRREEYEGTGMGLAIVKKVVERHGGRVWVDSTPGEGSTFHFTLPSA